MLLLTVKWEWLPLAWKRIRLNNWMTPPGFLSSPQAHNGPQTKFHHVYFYGGSRLLWGKETSKNMLLLQSHWKIVGKVVAISFTFFIIYGNHPLYCRSFERLKDRPAGSSRLSVQCWRILNNTCVWSRLKPFSEQWYGNSSITPAPHFSSSDHFCCCVICTRGFWPLLAFLLISRIFSQWSFCDSWQLSRIRACQLSVIGT